MKAAFIVPYFGKFPNYFNLLLKSVEANKENFTWLFVTDVEVSYDWPSNTIVKHCTFEELKEWVQSKFDFKITLESPYKLCDYKPAYGYIFEDWIKQYDFWGHCDIDCIYGKLNDFLGDKQYNYDKILQLGHMVLYRNTPENNRRFMEEVGGRKRYRETFSKKGYQGFDEYNPISNGAPNICDLWHEKGYSECLLDRAFANIYAKGTTFRLTVQQKGLNYKTEKTRHSFFIWDDGVLKRYYMKDGDLKEREFMYIHMMKRPMKNLVNGFPIKRFKIIPNQFDDIEDVPHSIRDFKQIKWRTINMQYIRLRFQYVKIKIKRKLGN